MWACGYGCSFYDKFKPEVHILVEDDTYEITNWSHGPLLPFVFFNLYFSSHRNSCKFEKYIVA